MNASDWVIKYMQATKCSSRVPRNDVGSLGPNLDDKEVPGRAPGSFITIKKDCSLMALLS
jgi:hypothetical protein